MEDDNSLELSLGLGLGCGGTSGKARAGTSDSKATDGSKSKQVVGNLNVPDGSFSQFFMTNTDNQDHTVQQRPENFWTDLGKRPALETEAVRCSEQWALDGKTVDAVENKRKMNFEDASLQKRREVGSGGVDVPGKSPTAAALKNHVSVTTEDGSSAENGDEAEGPASWSTSQHEERSKGSDAPKVNDKYFLNNPNIHGSQDAASVHTTKGFLQKLVTQVMHQPTDDQSSVVLGNGSNMQVAFGYPSGKLPTLETGTFWMLGPKPQIAQAYDRRSSAESDLKTGHVAVQAPGNLPAGLALEGRILDAAKGDRKHVEEVGVHSSSQTEDEAANGNKQNINPVDGLPSEGSTIRPGIAPGLKFGGSGSYPDLPWVSTTAPNGRTISGVTYKYSKNQIKIVCACHGSHMFPEEFIQHASADALDAENSSGAASFPGSNAAASAQS